MTTTVLRVGPRGDFATLGEAVGRAESMEGAVRVLVAPGVYREKVFTDRPDLSLEGQGNRPEDVVVVWDDAARKPLPDGRPMRTFNTATLFVGGDGFLAENLTIANDAGPGDRVGQAVAAYVDADRTVFRRCRLLGRQDTLFTGPLPPDPKEASDFGGPRDTGPGRISIKRPGSPAVGHQLYEDCYLEGDVDFLFGSAEAVFRRCEIRSLDLGQPVNGWISAASTPFSGPANPDPFLNTDERVALGTLGQRVRPLDVHGHLFIDCRLTAAPGVAPGSVFLGRPWRTAARTIYWRCFLGEHIHPQGWDDWNKPEARERTVYAEVDCFGPGARASRVGWTKVLSGPFP